MELDFFKNKFIVFEGGDSTGKTSVAKLLVEKLNDNNINSRFSFEPGDSAWGPLAALTKAFCKDKRLSIGPYGNLFAFLLDRAEHIDKVVKPELILGKTVICDRYTYSTVAYQLFGKRLFEDIEKSIGKEQANALLKWFMNPYPNITPDLVYYFPEKIGNREHESWDNFDNETKDFMTRVDMAYNDMYVNQEKYFNNKPKWIKISPGKSAEETLWNIIYYAV